MTCHRIARHFNRAKNFANNVYNQARSVGSAIDEGVGLAKRAYHIAAPALRELGVDTSHADRRADKAFTGYNALRDRVKQGDDVVSRAAGRLGGLMYIKSADSTPLHRFPLPLPRHGLGLHNWIKRVGAVRGRHTLLASRGDLSKCLLHCGTGRRRSVVRGR